MTTKALAYAATSPKDDLTPYSFERRDPRPDDVVIDISAVDETNTRINPALVDVAGSNLNLDVGSSAIMGEALTASWAACVRDLFLGTAEGPGLDRYVFDRMSGMTRKPAAAASVELVLARPPRGHAQSRGDAIHHVVHPFHVQERAVLAVAVQVLERAALEVGIQRPNFQALMRKHGLRASQAPEI